MDGFRNEYLTRGLTPNLLRFRKNSARIKLLETLDFSNALGTHHTIATGYYAQVHGVVGHRTWAFKPTGEAEYEYNKELYNYENENYTTVPIWKLNEFNGGTSGCIMWPGCEFKYSNESASLLMDYDPNIPVMQRFQTIVNWLNTTRTQPNLIMVYLEDPDRVAHIYGPDSLEVNKALKAIDDAQGYLYNSIDLLRLKKRINIIYLSDHSMYPVLRRHFISASAEFSPHCPPMTTYEYFLDSTQQEIVPKIPLDARNRKEQSLKCWNFGSTRWSARWSTPEYNYWRAPNQIIVLNKGEAWREFMEKYIKISEERNRSVTSNTIFGAHGYSKDEDVLFMAKGPIFIKESANTEFRMVDFFKLFTTVLRIPGDHERHGNFTRVVPILKSIGKKGMVNWTRTFFVILLSAIIQCTILYFSVNLYIAIKKGEIKYFSRRCLKTKDLNKISSPGSSAKTVDKHVAE